MVDWTENDWRLVQAYQDIAQALSALTFFADIPDKINEVEGRRFRCFHDMAVVCYCRPFTQSKGLPSLSFKKIGFSASPDQRALHREIVEYRNKVVAHTDSDTMRIAVKFYRFEESIPRLPLIAYDKGFVYFDRWRELEVLFRSVKIALQKTLIIRGDSLPVNAHFIRDFRIEEFPVGPFDADADVAKA